MRYGLHGLSVESGIALPCQPIGRTGRPDVTFEQDDKRLLLARKRGARPNLKDWFTHRRLRSGAHYLCWTDQFEFLVSPDGRRIRFRPLEHANVESLTAYLLGQVLSFTLLALGEEPLHATVVVSHGRAVAFLGACGSGKSTLGAEFVSGGSRMLTDDLLAIEASNGGYLAHAGLPRIKLYPRIALKLLGEKRGTRLNTGTTKRIVPLTSRRATSGTVPLAALYVLGETRERRITIESLSPSDALLAVLRNTFNTIVQDRHRLANQFALGSRLVERVPVRRQTYPRSLHALPTVRRAVLADLAGGVPANARLTFRLAAAGG